VNIFVPKAKGLFSPEFGQKGELGLVDLLLHQS